MATVLDSIIEGVTEDLAERARHVPMTQIRQYAAEAAPTVDAFTALSHGGADPAGVRIIAEVKRSSPSKGSLASIDDPGALASAYASGGASVISVLTEQRRFAGSLEDLARVRAAVDIPVLRKDFMVDEYQFYEARAYGADLVLLIVAALDDAQLRDYIALSRELGMHALVEAHTVEEIERAVDAESAIVGVNCRNLKTLEVDVDHYSQMARYLPETVVSIAESGVDGPQVVRDYALQGADAVLVGEALVRHGDPEAAVRQFRQTSRV